MHSHYFILGSSSFADDGVVTINGQDAKHIAKSLRLKAGDRIMISDGESVLFDVELTVIDSRGVAGKIVGSTSFEQPVSKLTVFQGLPKGRKMDLIVEKLTEIGVAGIVPVAMSRSIPEYGREREAKRVERWRAVAYEASKQSRRLWLPAVSNVLYWDEALEELDSFDEVLVPYEDFRGLKLGDVFEAKGNTAVFIGPEGGFDESEIADLVPRGAKLFSLGSNILRTETAAIVATTLIIDRMNS